MLLDVYPHQLMKGKKILIKIKSTCNKAKRIHSNEQSRHGPLLRNPVHGRSQPPLPVKGPRVNIYAWGDNLSIRTTVKAAMDNKQVSKRIWLCANNTSFAENRMQLLYDLHENLFKILIKQSHSDVLQSFKNTNTVLSLQVTQNQVVSQTWPMGCSLPTPDPDINCIIISLLLNCSKGKIQNLLRRHGSVWRLRKALLSKLLLGWNLKKKKKSKTREKSTVSQTSA